MSENLGIHDEVRTAFLPQPVTVGGLQVAVPCMGHLLLLSDRAPGFEAGNTTPEETLAVAVIFTTPGDKLQPLFGWSDDEWKMARTEMACRLPLHLIRPFAAAVARRIDDAMSPAIGAGDEKKTDSAGGSHLSSSPHMNTAGASP
jgi:hypothetical protein